MLTLMTGTEISSNSPHHCRNAQLPTEGFINLKMLAHHVYFNKGSMDTNANSS